MANKGIYPPDFDTEVGKVRLLIQDVDADNVNENEGTGEYLWQSDAEIEALLKIKGSGERAAIFILRQVAMSPAMQLKKWSSADLSVDGPSITRALRDVINDIEKSLSDGEAVDLSAFARLVPVGAPLPQPAFYPRTVPSIHDIPIDPTIPIRLI